MMRPITILTMLMAAGSGLYLYQAKHHAQMETREVGRLLAETDTVRQRIGILVTEYQLENDPERLRDLTKRFLPQLQGTQPTQFTAPADLDKRLPPVGAPPNDAAAPLEPDAPNATLPKPEDKSATAAVVAAAAPTPAKPKPVVTASTRVAPPAERVVDHAADRVAAAVPPRPSPFMRPRGDAIAMPQAAYRPPVAPAMSGGSMLGMARNSDAPTVSYSAFQMNSGGGG